MGSLVNLLSEASQLVSLVAESGGELSPELEKLLDSNTQDIAVKCDNYSLVLSEMESRAEYLKSKAKEFTDAAKAIENAEERLRDHLKSVLLSLPENKIEGVNYKFSLARSKPKVEVDQEKLPSDYWRETIKFEPDKIKIGEHLAAGKQISGARLVESYSLRKSVK
jgi:predicted nuclease with TOPRIM domain